MLVVAVIAIVAASAAVSIARTPSDESPAAALAIATPAIVVSDGLQRRVGSVYGGLSDEAGMVLAGAALIGAAAAVRRAA